MWQETIVLLLTAGSIWYLVSRLSEKPKPGKQGCGCSNCGSCSSLSGLETQKTNLK